jgi:hypothetical protein
LDFDSVPIIVISDFEVCTETSAKRLALSKIYYLAFIRGKITKGWNDDFPFFFLDKKRIKNVHQLVIYAKPWLT